MDDSLVLLKCFRHVAAGRHNIPRNKPINAELCKEIPAMQVLFYASVPKVNVTDASS